MSTTQQQNTTLGSEQNLPTHIRDIAGIRNRVVAWTTVDPAYDIDKYVCCRTFGMFVFLPCFWPHLLILWPCLLAGKVASVNAAKSQYWILDEKELKIILTNHEQCCFPGCSTSGDIVKSIPLSNITDCGFDEAGKGGLNKKSGDLPTIYVDTASASPKGHEATGLALKNSKAFVEAILSQRDKATATGNGAVTAAGTTEYDQGHVGGQSGGSTQKKSATERLSDVKDLYENGVLTFDEYDKKRQEIIASL